MHACERTEKTRPGSSTNRPILPRQPHSPADPEAYLARILDVLDTVPYPVESFLTLWCGARRLADVKWGNVRSFLAWAFFGHHAEDLTATQRATLARMVRARLPARWGKERKEELDWGFD